MTVQLPTVMADGEGRMIGDTMQTRGRRHFALPSMLLVIAVNVPVAVMTSQEPGPVKAKPTNTVVVRGCLNGSTVRHIETDDLRPNVPDKLRVRVDRVIRGQLKALDGHQVELNGTMRGIPGEETGILVADSDNGKVYLGGGDPNLGNDLVTGNQPPTVYAKTIKDIAPSCPAFKPK